MKVCFKRKKRAKRGEERTVWVREVDISLCANTATGPDPAASLPDIQDKALAEHFLYNLLCH